MTTVKTQKEQVLDMLVDGPLTSMESFKVLGCTRLAARVLELKNDGHIITTEMVKDGRTTYARYHLKRLACSVAKEPEFA
jgi:Helix-turn-helix domain